MNREVIKVEDRIIPQRTIKPFITHMDLKRAYENNQVYDEFLGCVEVPVIDADSYSFEEMQPNGQIVQLRFVDKFKIKVSLDGKTFLLIIGTPGTKRDGLLLNWNHATPQILQNFIDAFGIENIRTHSEYINIIRSPRYVDYSEIIDDFGEDVEQDELHFPQYYKSSKVILKEIMSLLELPHESSFYYAMLYGNAITTLENFLGDAFKYYILNYYQFFEAFINKYEPFKKEVKYTMPKIFNQGINNNQTVYEYLKKIVTNELNEIIFHNLQKVRGLYKNILGVTMPIEINNFYDAVENRHHIFHRNGLNFEKKPLNINKDQVVEVIQNVGKFMNELQLKLPSTIIRTD